MTHQLCRVGDVSKFGIGGMKPPIGEFQNPRLSCPWLDQAATAPAAGMDYVDRGKRGDSNSHSHSLSKKRIEYQASHIFSLPKIEQFSILHLRQMKIREVERYSLRLAISDCICQNCKIYLHRRLAPEQSPEIFRLFIVEVDEIWPPCRAINSV